MAVMVITKQPNTLLRRVKAAILNGEIDTWAVDSDGDFTHLSARWARLAWMRPRVSKQGLVFNIINPSNQRITKEVYAYYHGHLIRTLLAHFDENFKFSFATAQPSKGDRV